MAGSRTYRTKVLVLDKTKLKETDLILTMLDERGRQVRAVAKGARKPGGRLAARCELFPLVQFAPIGWLGGFIAGLKMSFGESVGPWRKHDEVFNVNKAHRAAADAGDAEERRRARRNGAADRQLISVTDDSKGAGKHAKK